MGQKVNPIGMRLQVNRTWDSRWYAESKDYGNLLLEDLKMREFIHKEAKQAGVARVIIERPHKKCRVTIHAARPGVIIGKKKVQTSRPFARSSLPSPLRNCTSTSLKSASPNSTRNSLANLSANSLSAVCRSAVR